MSVSCLYNKKGCARIKIFLSVAWVKPLSLIYIIRSWDDNILKSNVNKHNTASKRLHAISIYKLWGKDNSVRKKLTRVPHIIGSRTALGGNDISLGGLYHTTIYQWIDHVGVSEDYAFCWVMVILAAGVK